MIFLVFVMNLVALTMNVYTLSHGRHPSVFLVSVVNVVILAWSFPIVHRRLRD